MVTVAPPTPVPAPGSVVGSTAPTTPPPTPAPIPGTSGPASIPDIPNSTIVGGSITTNTTWNLAGSPYIVVSDVTVVDGVTLTIAAGVEVHFQQYRNLLVYGNLVAAGTSAATVQFKRDSGSGSGYWGYIQIGGGVDGDSDSSQLSYVTIDGGGYSSQHSLYIYRSRPSLDHLTIRNSGGDGLYVYEGGTFTLNTATIENNGGDGIEIYYSNGGQTLTNLTLRNNAGYGLKTDHQDAVLTLSNSAISNNGVAARVSVNALLQNNTWTGNTRNEIELNGGTMTVNRTWSLQADAYRIVGQITVNDSKTLTVGAGVTVLFDDYQFLYINGVLSAVGTAANPITFERAAAATYAWGYIQIGGGVDGDSDSSQLSYVTIDGGGYSSQHSLYIYRSRPSLDHLTIRNSGGDGLYVYEGGTFTLNTATIENNGGDGIEIYYSNGGQTLTNLTLRNNAGYGLKTDHQDAVLTLSNSAISNNGVAARVSVNALLQNNTWTGNTRNEIELNGGTMTVNRTWSLQADAYRIVGQITVNDSKTLTVGAGVTVLFDDYQFLYINGVLSAVGTAANPITFERAAAATYAWGYIQIGGGVDGDSDSSQLSYVTIDGGGYSSQHSLYIYRSRPSLDHLTIRNSGGDGLYVYEGGTFTLNTATIENNGGDGIEIYYSNGGQTLTNLTLRNNAGYGLKTDHQDAVLTLSNSAISNNGVAARVSVNALLQNNTWTGNTRNEIELNGGTMTVNRTWSLQADAYRIVGQITVNDSKTLTVGAGVTVLFDDYQFLYINGVLSAVGTAANPITFERAAAATYAWGYIQIGGGVDGDSDSSQLSYVTIDGGGYSSQHSLYIYRSRPSLDHLTIRNSGGDGLYVYEGGTFTLNTATIENNGGDGIEIYYSNGGQTLTNLTLRNNAGYGLKTDHQDAVLTLSNSAISNNGVAARVSVNALLQNNTWTGNTRNEIELNGGTMTVNRTWSLQADAYRIVGYVTVEDGRILTVDPGVTVIFDQSQYLIVNGTIMAVGNSGSPIRFRSALSWATGYWCSLQIGGGAIANDSDNSQLSYVVIQGGGCSGQPSLYLYQSRPALDHITIRNGGGDGLRGYGGGAFVFDSGTIENNSGYGVRIDNSTAAPTIRNSSITGNAVAAYLPPNAVLQNNAWTENTRNEIEFTWGTIAQNHTWTRENAPYRVLGSVTVGNEATLTVSPGVELRFNQHQSLDVQGNLIAVGTPTNPIRFGPAIAGFNGYWGYIRIAGDGNQSRLSYTSIEGGGYSNQPSLYIWRSTPVLEFLDISGSGGDAIQVFDSDDVAVTLSSISGNAGFGLRNQTPAKVVSAQYNFWGDPSGPYHPTLNPTGTGQQVSDGVLFDPWLHSADYDPWAVREATPLSLDTPVEGQVASYGFKDYSVDVSAGQSLLVQVTPLSAPPSLWLYGRLGNFASLATFDFRARETTARGVYELLVTPTRSGTYYFAIFGQQAQPYRILARIVNRYFSDISPRAGGNTGQTTLTVRGLNFVEGMQVSLRGTGLPTYTPEDALLISSLNLQARFDLAGATVGTYDVRVAWPDSYEEIIPAAFEVVAGIGPRLSATIRPAPFVRRGRTYTLAVNYTNTGDSDLVAPLFVASNQRGATMRPSGSGFFENEPVQLIGVNSAGLAGTVPPGATGSVNVDFHVPEGLLGSQLPFKLEVMVADNTPIDWNAVAGEVRPPGISDELWNVFWPMVTSQVGSTWAEYGNALAANASYLSTLGRNVSAVRDLFRYEVRKALGMTPRTVLAESVDASVQTPGLPLRFERVFPGSLEGRFYVGPLGYGWSHSYDIYAEELSDGSVRIHAPGAFIRAFHRNSDGSYTGLPGEQATLTRTDGLFVLTETDGLVYRFRGDGKLDTVQDTRGNRITASYNGSGQLVQVSHSNGDSFTLTYNAQGRVASLTDHAGRTTQFVYDGSGQHLLSVTAPGGRITTYAYNTAAGVPGSHALQSVAFPDGSHQFYAYDGQGRLAEEQKDGGAERVTYAYDSAGRITATDASGATAVTSPDEAGRPSRLKDGLGHALNLAFDDQYNLTSMRDQAGQPYSFSYDHLGNVLGTQDPEGNRLTLGYDYRFSQLNLLRDARGNESRFGYDAAGNLTTLTYPDGSQEILTYDAAGNPTSFRNRAGQTIQYTYNARGQVTRKDYPDGSWAAYTYDAAGNMTSAADANGTIAMEYDAATDRLTKITYPSGHFFSYTYNAAGLRTRRTDQDGKQLNYEYDAAGRLARMADESNATIVTYQYDGVGRVSRKTLGNGTYATYEYDAAGQITHLVHYKSDSAILSRFDYTYDALGNRTSITTLEGVTSYTDDTLGQLTGVTYPDGRQVTYAYDGAGNRTVVTENGTPTAYTANNLNQYTEVGNATYAYDANGNLVSKTEGGQTTTYHYDFENRLVRVDTPAGSVSYAYDPMGRRIARTDASGTVRYLSDGDHVAAELDASNAVTARYTHGAETDEVLTMKRSGNTYWYNLDALGSVRNLTTAGGQVAESYDYDAYGLPTADSTVENPWFFTGREYDTTTELQYNRARYYMPSLGRFATFDSIGVVGGSNAYAYCNNHPLTSRDPFGYAWYNNPWFKWGVGVVLTVTGAALTFYGVGGLAAAAVISTKVHWSVMNYSSSWKWWASSGLTGLGIAVAFLAGSYPLLPFILLAASIHWALLTMPVDFFGNASAQVVNPIDPNEKVGSMGVGAGHLVGHGETLQYTVYFENQASASAPAQEVFVTDYLDPNLDWTTFHPTEIAFGETVIPIVDGTYQFASLQTIPDYRPGVNKAWWVDITAELNPFTGRTRWVFRTLDPDTGELPADPFAGFLPPNDANGRGEGHVTFSVHPSQAAPNGTVLSNSATIIFDTEVPIQTNTVTNTLGICADIVPPPGIGIEDIQSVAGRWGLQSGDPGWDDLYDLDGDGEITVQDIAAAAENWGQTCQ